MRGENTVFVHPQALCESRDVGEGTRIWAFAHVMAGARIGKECNICAHTFVEDGAVIGDGVTVKNGISIWTGVVVEDHVFLGPNVAFTNDLTPRAEFKKGPDEFASTLVKRGASIGANATLLCGLTIGEYAFVGAGSVVTRSVVPYAVVVGNPARQNGWMCACGRSLGGNLSCGCGRAYRRAVKSGGLVEACAPRIVKN
jgi:acetyltransferase-like isoleucine patch superfamily enzyme